MPKRLDRLACVAESILKGDGNIETIMLDERYKPYSFQRVRVENVCGSFTERVDCNNLKGVLVNTQSQFGKQREVYHLHGNVTLSSGGKGSFMGARGVNSIEKLASSLELSNAKNFVHMAVICGKLGKRVQVKSGGLLETRLMSIHSQNIRVEGRMYDHTNTVRMSVHNFSEDGVFALPSQFQPERNDWIITGRGTVIIRFTWKRIEWTRESEEACLGLCNRVISACLI